MSSPQVNTQYDQPATQTQVFDDMPLDDEVGGQPENLPWGQLVSRSADGPHFDLQDFPPDDQGRFNVHLIGRSAQCVLQLTSSPRISNKHCIIYCKQNIADPNNPRLEAWIEDLSANGTFINGETRLTKNVPRLLHHRDEIFLVNPEFKRMAKAGTKILDDIAQNSFVVMLNLPSPVDEFIQASRDYDMQLSQNEASQGSRMDRTNTVNRLLGQKRCIYDHYEIKTLLGEGTSGSVYHGINKETGRDWAVKIIPTKNLSLLSSVINNKGRPGDLNGNELTKEAELLRSLRHPHIIHLEDIFADNRRLFLVMELSSGGDLFDRIVKKKHYPEHEARIVVGQILRAIDYLHEKNIAHRDIKPENILLVNKHSDVDIKLTDFGLAKKVDESGKMKTFCGTPQYFAPEVLQRRHTTKGAGTYSLAADMWSIGVIMFVLLEGNYPFNEATLSQQISSAQYSFAAPVWKKVSEDAKNLIRQLLVVDPTARLTAKQALASPWFAASTTTLMGPPVLPAAAASAQTAAQQNGKAGGASNGARANVVVNSPAVPERKRSGPMVVDGEEQGVAVRSETVSTNVTDPTVIAGVLAGSSSTHSGGRSPVPDGRAARSASAIAEPTAGATSAVIPTDDDFHGTANMSITTAVQLEFGRVNLNTSNHSSLQAVSPPGTSPRKGTRRANGATAAAAAVPPSTGKRKLAGAATNSGTPVRSGDKRGRKAGDSAVPEGRKIEDFFAKQGGAAAGNASSSSGAGVMTRRVTRSASTLGANSAH